MKHLFQYDSEGQAHELDAFCCLDFYVHESQQRKGLGRLLFAVAENLIGIPANYWGFDKPSPKLFAFLEKYYGMRLKPEFSRQVSKFAMHEDTIKLLGRLFTQIKMSRIVHHQSICENLDDQQYYQEEMGIVTSRIRDAVKSQIEVDPRKTIELPDVSLKEYNSVMSSKNKVQQPSCPQT